MADLIKHSGKIFVYGTLLRDNKPNVGAYVVLWSEDSSSEIANTTTDKYGKWEFEFTEEEFTEGNYTVRFYGSGTTQKLESEGGDWQKLKINFSKTDAEIKGLADGRIEVKVGDDTEIGNIRSGKKADGSKLDLDNDIDDGTTYKRITSTEKTNWEATKTTVNNNKSTWDSVVNKADQSALTAVQNQAQKLNSSGDATGTFGLGDYIALDGFGNIVVGNNGKIILEHSTGIQLGSTSKGSLGTDTLGGYLQLLGNSDNITFYNGEITFSSSGKKIASISTYIYTSGDFSVSGQYRMSGVVIIDSNKLIKNISGVTLSSGYFQGDYKSSDGSVGKTENVDPQAADLNHLIFKDGLYINKDVTPV